MGQVVQDVLTLGAIAAAPLTAGTSLATWLPATLSGAATVDGMINQQNAQKAQNAAYSAAQGNQSQALQGATSLAQQLATGPNMQPIFDAEGSGVKTLQSKIGGVANPGAMIKELYGQNIGNGIGAALNTRSGDLQGGINALLNTGSQYGQMGGAAGRAASGANPYLSGFTALAKMGLPNRNQNTNTATGLGSGGGMSGGPDPNIPPWFPGVQTQPPPPPTQVISGPDTPPPPPGTVDTGFNWG